MNNDVTDQEKLQLAIYRINEALGYLEHRDKNGKMGIGWASAHATLCKAKWALGLEIRPQAEISNTKPIVKEIEKRLVCKGD